MPSAPSGTRRSAARRSTRPQSVAGAVVSSSTNCAPNPEERSRAACCQCCHQPIAHERAGVRLSPLKAAIFDAIKAAGQSGVASYGLLHLFERPVKRSTVKVHVGQINTLLEDTAFVIRSDRRVWRLERRYVRAVA